MVDLTWWTKRRGAKIFLREKPIDLLLCLSEGMENYPSKLAKDARCTYSHTVHLLQKVEKAGLVEFVKKGRLKLVNLTGKGKNVVDLFKDLKQSFI